MGEISKMALLNPPYGNGSNKQIYQDLPSQRFAEQLPCLLSCSIASSYSILELPEKQDIPEVQGRFWRPRVCPESDAYSVVGIGI